MMMTPTPKIVVERVFMAQKDSGSRLAPKGDVTIDIGYHLF